MFSKCKLCCIFQIINFLHLHGEGKCWNFKNALFNVDSNKFPQSINNCSTTARVMMLAVPLISSKTWLIIGMVLKILENGMIWAQINERYENFNLITWLTNDVQNVFIILLLKLSCNFQVGKKKFKGNLFTFVNTQTCHLNTRGKYKMYEDFFESVAFLNQPFFILSVSRVNHFIARIVFGYSMFWFKTLPSTPQQ